MTEFHSEEMSDFTSRLRKRVKALMDKGIEPSPAEIEKIGAEIIIEQGYREISIGSPMEVPKPIQHSKE